MKLRPYQVQALQKRAHRRITVLPTGTGKTAIMAALAEEEARRKRSTLVLVHREELIPQTVGALERAGYEDVVGVVQGPQKDWQRITVGMQQTLRRDPAKIPPFHNVIVDEAHRYTTKKSGHALLDVLEAGGASIFGFTATPQINMKAIYGPGKPFTGISFRRTIPWAIANGYLCDVRCLTVPLGIDLSRVKRDGAGDYQAGDLGAKLAQVKAPKRIVEAWEKAQARARRRRTIVFTPTVKFGSLVAAAFGKSGLAPSVREVYGETPKAERESTIEAFRQGEVDVLVNVIVGAEGFDVPEVDCIVQARPTRSWTLYTQCVGRGLRTAAGKQDCLVLDVAGNAEEHDLATLPKVVNAPEMRKGKSLREVLDEDDDPEHKARTLELDHGVSELREALLYAPVNWVEVGEEFVAPFDSGQVVAIAPVEDEDGLVSYGVFLTDVRGGGEQEVGVFHYQTDATEAAEDLIREEGDGKLSKRAARWRQGPPTPGQLKWYKRGATIPATRGEASDQITIMLYQRARRATA